MLIEQVALQEHFGIPVNLSQSQDLIFGVKTWGSQDMVWCSPPEIKSHRETFSHTVIPHTWSWTADLTER